MFPSSASLRRLCVKLRRGSPERAGLLALTLSLSLSSGWKLNPVVGAVYAPELYAGKLFPSPPLPRTSLAAPEAAIAHLTP